MSLGKDLKEIFTEMGTGYQVIRDTQQVGSEYGRVIVNSQATKPFIVLNFLKLVVPYDSVIMGGDHVLLSGDRKYLVTVKNPEFVSDEVITSECVLLRSNCEVIIQRGTEEEEGYEEILIWNDLFPSGVPVLLTESLRDQDSLVDDIGTFEEHGMELYLSANVKLKLGDRVIDGDDIYEVQTIKTKRYDGVHMARLRLDTRQ